MAGTGVVPYDNSKESRKTGSCEASKHGEQYEIKHHQLMKQEVDRSTQETEYLKSVLDAQKKRYTALELEVHELRNEKSLLESRNSSLVLNMDIIRQSEVNLKQRIEVLSKEAEDESKKSHALAREVHALQLEIKELKHGNSQFEEELKETKNRLKLASCKANDHEKEVRKLQRQIKNLICNREEEKGEAERMKKHADMATSDISALEKEIEEYKRTNDKLQSENQAYRKENEQLRMLKGELEAHNSINEKDVQKLRLEVSALQASAGARGKALTESHQREIERLRQMHRSDRKEQDKRHAVEKEQMQSQIEMLLQTLSEDKRVEREALKTAVQQLAETNMATNQFLHAAFAAAQGRYHRQRHGAAANIRQLPDDA